MGIKQIPTRIFLAFLKEKGLIEYETKSSHTKFDYPKDHPKLLRPLIVRTNENEIPLTHIDTNLRSLNCSKKEFADWLRKTKSKRSNKK